MYQHLKRPAGVSRIIRQWRARGIRPESSELETMLAYLEKLEGFLEMYFGVDARDGTLADDALRNATDAGLVRE